MRTTSTQYPNFTANFCTASCVRKLRNKSEQSDIHCKNATICSDA